MGVTDRTSSESSDDLDIRPLELADLQRDCSEDLDEDQRYPAFDGLTGGDKFFSVVYGLKKKKDVVHDGQRSMLARMAWKNAYIKVKSMTDIWEKFHIGDLPAEEAVRYRYNALRKKWDTDHVVVKIEKTSFNRGAMRECFRMKKLSNFSICEDWQKAHNYVAKRYMDLTTTDDTYFSDVKLQMDAKLWGEEYNRHNPPKKVDIFQMVVIRMVNRPGQPLFHVEHFIEGNYTKYNSNSGYVSSKRMRLTPHAFSHFTFESSGHELIVVDVQGVGDLYTDPQIHTAHGNDYGDGNLGTRGMALFFHSHVCNCICQSLGLSQFDMAPSERQALLQDKKKQVCPKTKVRGNEEPVIYPNKEERMNLTEYLRQRSMSSGCVSHEDETIINNLSVGSFDSLESMDNGGLLGGDDSEDSAIASAIRRRGGVQRTMSACVDGASSPPHSLFESLSASVGKRGSNGWSGPIPIRIGMPQRRRHESSSSECDSVTRQDMPQENKEENKEIRDFSMMVTRRSRPSNIVAPDEHQDILLLLDQPRPSSVYTILGQVHLDVAKYHELNRFSEEGATTYDHTAAFFHVIQAARCGLLEGLLAAAKMLLGLPHYILPDVELPPEDRDEDLGYRFLEEACRAGDRWALLYLATALDTGTGLPEGRCRDWHLAYILYERAMTGCDSDDEGGYDAVMETPPYTIRARQAAMILEGGFSLEKDANRAGELYSEAAELATEAMKGKLAAKYYMDAENAWMECEE